MLPSIRQVFPEIEWKPLTVEAQRYVLSTTRRLSSGYSIGEQLSPPSRDPSYGEPFLPAMLPQPTFEPFSTEFRPMPPGLPFPTNSGGPALKSGRGNLIHNIFEPPYTNSIQCSNPALYRSASARTCLDPTMTPQSYSIEQPLFSYVLPDAREVGTVLEGIKRRKKREKIPKEAIEKLQTWLKAHINHPYPTESEKQELMKETMLETNQISNWFINTRRRKMHAIINNSRIVTENGSARSAPSAISGDPPLLGLGQEILPSNTMDMDFSVGRQTDGSGVENGSDREVYNEEQASE